MKRIATIFISLVAASLFAQGPGYIGPGVRVGSTQSNLVAGNVQLIEPQWVDIPVFYAYSATGPDAPSLVNVTGGSPIKLLGFNASTHVIYGMTQFPHNIAVTNAATPVLYYEPHVHFTVTVTPAGAATNVTWRLIWQFANIGQNFGLSATTNTVTTSVGTNSVPQLAEFGHFTNNTMGISGIFRCRLDRIVSPANEYDSNPTVLLNGFDIHVPVGNLTGFGSRQDTVQ